MLAVIAALAAAASPAVQTIVRSVSAARLENSVRTLASFGTRHTLSDADGASQGIGAARRWIEAELRRAAAESGGRMRVELDEFVAPAGPRVPSPTRIVNVVATLEGARPESRARTYVVSGHYDSRNADALDARGPAPGANDDGSGTAAVIELARVLARHPLDATVVFMAVAGEEQGLLGARHWAEDAASAGRDIAGMITNDIVGNSRAEDGRVDRSRVRLFAEGVPPRGLPPEQRWILETGGENDTPPRQFARAIQEAAERYVPDLRVTLVWRRDRYLRGGDHLPFLDLGWPAVRFTEPAEDYRRQHVVEDTVAGVDFAYLAKVTRANAAALASLALAPARPRGVLLETARLENDSTLRWDANLETDLAGYRIVWRETTAPTWQKRMDVGNVTRATVKVSKDNVVFGVIAVDKDGHASDAAYPRPAR